MTDAPTDAELARAIATATGDLLERVRRSGLFAGKALGQAGDRIANAFILEALAAHRPGDPVLSEEEDHAPPVDAPRLWIVDPLDGTREYGEGRDDWAVHVGLVENGVPTIGAVALPGVPLTLCTATPPVIPPAGPRLQMLVSRTRPPPAAIAVAAALDAELVPMGSAGAKAMAVLRGVADIYLHSGGQYVWDNCAPAAVALAAGAHVSRIDGSPLVYDGRSSWMPDLLICRRDLAGTILDRLAGMETAE